MTETTRKLATIRRIKQLLPIAGADRIEIALVDGWQVVVKKGEFKEGALAVYFEIDSWVPNTIAPFLTGEGKPPKEYNGVQGERLKTIKLRKQLSQGLLLPLSVLGREEVGYTEGTNVTERLGIQKWEAAEEVNEKRGGNQMASKTRSFPHFLRKTDQERVQNFGHMIAQNLDTEFEVTVKKDGSSMTVFMVVPGSEYYQDAKEMIHGKPSLWSRLKQFVLRRPDEPVFGICSRNLLLNSEGNSNFHKAAEDVILELMDMPLNRSIAIQGEVVAPDIQGNYEKVNGVEFHIFDIFDIEKQEYMLPEERQGHMLDYFMFLNHATVVDQGTLRNILQLKDGEDPVQKALVYASGEGDNAGVMREGVVFKAKNKDFSFKAISNEYLLHKG